ncbi:spore coat protein [Lysinibacillus sp. 3P01SB]|uniref:spore coat protein n=1 Tax=Lysinibacillus sp. 3P01SB TaxID=3132284 RepID=UPI0039A64721
MFTQPSDSQDNGQTMSMNHGAHEILDVHEVLSASIGALNQCVLMRDQIQDPELLAIVDRQYAFMLDEYNITMEAYKTGHDPKHPTKTYNMQMSNDVKYGLTPSEPKKPIQSASEVNDAILSGALLTMHKTAAVGKTQAALESTNPVVRRVLQDSVPNCVEMAYEVSLYQNKRGIYQVPQFAQNDMNTMLNMYGQAEKAKNMPN